MMRRVLPALALAVFVAACGSDSSSPAAPTQVSTPLVTSVTLPAGPFVLSASVSSNCESRRNLGASLGLAFTDNCAVTGTVRNAGSGCASGVHGSLTVVETGSAANWSVAGLVRPGDVAAITAGPVTLPNRGSYRVTVSPTWTNVSCS